MCVSGAAGQIGWSLRRLRRGRLGRLGPRSSLAWHPARITSIARIRSTLATLNVPVHCPHCQMFGGTCRRSRCIDLVRKLVGYPLQVLEESIGRSLGNVTVALTWLSLACSVRIDVSRFLPSSSQLAASEAPPTSSTPMDKSSSQRPRNRVFASCKHALQAGNSCAGPAVPCLVGRQRRLTLATHAKRGGQLGHFGAWLPM